MASRFGSGSTPLVLEQAVRDLAVLDRDLGRALGQALAGPDVERDAGPAPVVDHEPGGDERLGLRLRVDLLLLAVARDLAWRRPSPGRTGRARRRRRHRPGRDVDGPQDLDLLVAQGVRLERRRRLHRDQADELEEVVLEDVARGAGLLVERAAVLDADRLGHGDLDVVDVAPVPERLEDAVAEPEDQQVPDRLLAEVVVDAIDLRLAEDLADLAVEPLRRLEVVTERLLDDDPPPAAVVVLVVESDPPELGRRSRRTARAGSRGRTAGCRACPCSVSMSSRRVGQPVERRPGRRSRGGGRSAAERRRWP